MPQWFSALPLPLISSPQRRLYSVAMTRYVGAVLACLLAGQAQAMYVWVDGQGARHVSTHPRHCFRGGALYAPECEPIYGNPRAAEEARRRQVRVAAAAGKARRAAEVAAAVATPEERRRMAPTEACHPPTLDLSKSTADAFGGFVNGTAAYRECSARRRLARKDRDAEVRKGASDKRL